MVSRLRTTIIKIIFIGLTSSMMLPIAADDTVPSNPVLSKSWFDHPWTRPAAYATGALVGIGAAYGLYKFNRYRKVTEKNDNKKSSKKPHVEKPLKEPVELRVIRNITLLTAGLVIVPRMLWWMNLISEKTMYTTQNTLSGFGAGALLTYLYQQAIEHAKKEDSADTFMPVIPNVTFDDYTLDEEILGPLLQDIEILTSDDLLERIRHRGAEPKKGMLLYGPPGSGKTYLVAAIAGSSGIPLLNIKISDVVSRWYGDAERNMAAIFEKARAVARDPKNSKKKCILFFDEIDTIAKKRTGNDEFDPITPRLVSTFLQEIDGLESTNEIIVIGCTNIPDKIDSAMISRLGKPIYIPLPSQETRTQFIDKKLQEESLQYIHAGNDKERNALAMQVAEIMDGHDFRALTDLMQHIIRDSEYYKVTPPEEDDDDIDGYQLTDENRAALASGLVNHDFVITRARKYSQKPMSAHGITYEAVRDYDLKVSADRVAQRATALERLPLDG